MHPKIAFNREALYAHYAQASGSSRDKIDLNILAEADVDWTQIPERMYVHKDDVLHLLQVRRTVHHGISIGWGPDFGWAKHAAEF